MKMMTFGNRVSLSTHWFYHGKSQIILLFLVIALLVPFSYAAKEEGDSCDIKSMTGTCLPASKCTTMTSLIDRNIITPEEIPSCGLSVFEEMICCPLETTLGGNWDQPRTTTTVKAPVDERLPQLINDIFDVPTTTQNPQTKLNDIISGIFDTEGTSTTTGRPFAVLSTTQNSAIKLNDIISDIFDTEGTSTTTARPLRVGNLEIDPQMEYLDLNQLLQGTNKGPRAVNYFGKKVRNPVFTEQEQNVMQNLGMIRIPEVNLGAVLQNPDFFAQQVRQAAMQSVLENLKKQNLNFPEPPMQQQYPTRSPTIQPQSDQENNVRPGAGRFMNWGELQPPRSRETNQQPYNPQFVRQFSNQQTSDFVFPSTKHDFGGRDYNPFTNLNPGSSRGFDTYLPNANNPFLNPSRQTDNQSPRNNAVQTPRPWGSPVRPPTRPSGPLAPTEARFQIRPAAKACENILKSYVMPVTPHILEGTRVEEGEYPHMAAIGFPSFGNENQYDFKCGGSLIDSRFVLTAAHCVYNPQDQPSIVRLGTTELKSNKGTDIPIKTITIHPDYVGSRKYNDIALLHLETPAPSRDEIRPACLVTDYDDLPAKTEFYVTGWGTIDVAKRLRSDILLKAKLDLVPLDVCNATYANENAFNRNLEHGLLRTQFCAHDASLRRDACQGDSGGPFNAVVDENLYKIVGIISSGFSCGTSIPALYTNVTEYLDFIEKIVWDN